MGPITGENTKGPDNLWALFLCGRGGTAYAPVFNTGALAGDCGCKSHRPHRFFLFYAAGANTTSLICCLRTMGLAIAFTVRRTMSSGYSTRI